MKAKIKTIFQTLMFVFIVGFISAVWYAYNTSIAKEQEEITNEVVETLEEIIVYEKPDFERENNQTFINSVGQCVNYIYNTTTDIIPVNFEVLLAQAALESGWGNSRFAIEGRNLFGIRTYDLREPHMLPSNNPKKWGVKVYSHECDSVLNYMQILNNGGAYKKYRELRENGIDDPYILVETLDAYAADKHYFSKIKSILTKIRSEYEVR